MRKRLKINLIPGWSGVRRNASKGPATILRDQNGSGALQFSITAEYKSGVVPNPSEEQLIALARGSGERYFPGGLVETASGTCVMGRFGSAVFQSEDQPRVQFWYVSNGYDFVLVTHTCVSEPDEEEVDEAQQIVAWLDLTDEPEQT